MAIKDLTAEAQQANSETPAPAPAPEPAAAPSASTNKVLDFLKVNAPIIAVATMFVVVIAGSAFLGSQVAGSLSSNSDSQNQDIDQQDQTGSDNVVSNDCIITVDGMSYDVTELKKTHTGGDVFECGSDNTDKFVSFHNQDFELIAGYYVDPLKGVDTSILAEFTAAEIAANNTAESCYVVYKNVVYNATESRAWSDCEHKGIMGGTDITIGFPHDESYVTSLPIAGIVAPGENVKSGTTGSTEYEREDEEDKEVENEMVVEGYEDVDDMEVEND